MPYVNERDRIEGHDERNLNIILDGKLLASGNLNYVLTKVIIAYAKQHGLRYQIMNDIVGALDNCKDEFRRKVQHPYEDNKIQENGDVYNELYR